MALSSLFLYITLFVSLFFEIFLLITYLEVREEIKAEKERFGRGLKRYPSVSIIIPCFNEERTVRKTILSLLSLDYPKDKLSLVAVDDGSTDGTLETLREFEKRGQIRVFTKKNGGKHTALNLALEHIDTELVGCLDADSFVDPSALKIIASHFEDEETMAVTPSIKIHEPQTVLQYVQRVEYSWGIFLRRLLASLGALYVTPGPFSIFRTKVFRELGGYRFAHHTEDLEMAMRLQKSRYKITNSHEAVVYTVGPAKLKGLYRQRVRWSYGFLNNAFDYREMFFNRKYGNIGLFIMPVATFSIFSTLYATGNLLWGLLARIPDQIARYEAVGLRLSAPNLALSWFSFNASMVFWIMAIGFLITLGTLFLSLKFANGKAKLGRDVLYYLTLYIFIVPLWLTSAVYSTLSRKAISWR